MSLWYLTPPTPPRQHFPGPYNCTCTTHLATGINSPPTKTPICPLFNLQVTVPTWLDLQLVPLRKACAGPVRTNPKSHPAPKPLNYSSTFQIPLQPRLSLSLYSPLVLLMSEISVLQAWFPKHCRHSFNLPPRPGVWSWPNIMYGLMLDVCRHSHEAPWDIVACYWLYIYI